MASRETLQKLIQFGNAEQFATHAEDWSACSSAAILNAAVEQLGKLTQQQCRTGSIFFYLFRGSPPLPAALSTTALSTTERNEGASSGVERSGRNVLWEA